MRSRLPLWLRALLQLSFLGSSVVERVSTAYNAAVRRCVPAHLRDATTVYMYERSASYQAGRRFGRGGYFDHLFPWEEELVRVFPEGGRLLLGAAGSGRELSWLAAHKFRVVAFEPSALALLAAERVGAPNPDVQVLQASYTDLADGILCQIGPMADVLKEGPFDGVILGWGSLSHLWDSAERSRLFSALKQHSPRAPIVASFLRRRDDEAVSPESHQLRARLRKLTGWVFSSTDVTFIGGHGFCHLFADREVDRLALDHGYVVDRYDPKPYPHALFRPANYSEVV